MGVTKIDELNAPQSQVYLAGSLPIYPYQYYDAASGDVDSVEWRGGEIAYNTADNRFYIQQNSSGTTAEWKRLLDATVSA